MEKPETEPLFTELSSEESAAINGGHGGCRYSRRRRFIRSWNRRHHYRSYPRSRRSISVRVRFNRRFY